jgi:ATP-dependent RNA helicase RhlE
VHRIGRTGRAGALGKAVSFCNTEERAYVKDIQKLIGLNIPVVSNHSFPASGKIAERKEQPQRFKKRLPLHHAN